MEAAMLSNLLPHDIVVDILLRLPVKSLLRFRCVCKSWCKFISNPNFVKMHLDNGSQNEKLHLMLTSGHKMYSSIDSSPPLARYEQTVEIDYPLKYPEFKRGDSVHIRGSCDGLLCIETSRGISRFAEKTCFIWNPSTRQYRKIPSPPYYHNYDGLQSMELFRSMDPVLDDYNFEEVAYGFGYDSKAEDYKLVKVVTRHFLGFMACKVEVYTLGSNSWKQIRFDSRYRISDRNGVFVNGALHWVARNVRIRGLRLDVIAFNFEDEKFVEISPPEHFDNKFIIGTVGNLGGCLCACGVPDRLYIDVWVMKEHGVRESWTKLFSIARLSLSDPNYLEYFTPLRLLKNGEILISIKNNSKYASVIYDPEHQSVRKPKLNGRNCSIAHTYVESLVSINRSTYLEQRKKKASLFSCVSWLQSILLPNRSR